MGINCSNHKEAISVDARLLMVMVCMAPLVYRPNEVREWSPNFCSVPLVPECARNPGLAYGRTIGSGTIEGSPLRGCPEVFRELGWLRAWTLGVGDLVFGSLVFQIQRQSL